MSERWAIRSSGEPYFALVQPNLAFMDAANAPWSAGSLASASLRLEVAFHDLPVRHTSADETHPLFSYHDSGVAGQELAHIGVAPDGRVIGFFKGFADLESSAGLIAPEGDHYRTIESQIVEAAGTVFRTLKVDGGTVASTSAAGSFTLAPANLARFMLFNGLLGVTRCGCSIRSARATFSIGAGTGNPGTIEWPITEGKGTAIGATIIAGSFPSTDFGLDDAFYNPLFFPLLWGAVPSTDPQAAHHWKLSTPYTRIVPRALEYYRVGAP